MILLQDVYPTPTPPLKGAGNTGSVPPYLLAASFSLTGSVPPYLLAASLPICWQRPSLFAGNVSPYLLAASFSMASASPPQ